MYAILSKPEMESGMYRNYLTFLSIMELNYLSPGNIQTFQIVKEKESKQAANSQNHAF